MRATYMPREGASVEIGNDAARKFIVECQGPDLVQSVQLITPARASQAIPIGRGNWTATITLVVSQLHGNDSLAQLHRLSLVSLPSDGTLWLQEASVSIFAEAALASVRNVGRTAGVSTLIAYTFTCGLFSTTAPD